jgi:glyoxylase-like metal-dependent hydrolase (beta-lactamase superfamily II)
LTRCRQQAESARLSLEFFDAAQACVAPNAAAVRFETFNDGSELDPGIRSIVIPSHTPGRSAYRIESDGHVLLAWSDVIHVASIELRNPHASVEYDTDAGLARRSHMEMPDAAP